MNHVLTIVGSSARAAAFSAVRAGFSVRAGDLFADADLSRIAEATRVADYPGGLAEVVRGAQPGAWMYTGALENHPALVDRIARVRPLWGNPGAVLRRVRHPRHLAAALVKSGLCVPEVRFDPSDVPRDGSWLVKPRRSAGGTGVALLTEAEARGHTRGCYFQQYVAGVPYSAVYVATGGRSVLLGVTRQLIGQAWTGAQGFRYCGSIGPIALPNDALATLLRIGEVLAGAFELVGLFGVDLIVNAAGIWPVEVNPRYTASVELLERTGMASAIQVHAAACEMQRLPARVTESRGGVSGKAVVFAALRLRVPQAWVEQALSSGVAERPMFADIPLGGTIIETGWPIVTIFADGHDQAAVESTLRHAAHGVVAALEGAS